MDELEAELETVFETRTTDEWVADLAEERGIPVGPIHTVDEALSNPQTDARGVVGTIEHPTAEEIPTIEHPLNYRNARAGFRSAPPLLGEDTESVLRELGYDDDEIEALVEAGAIPGQSDD